MINDGEVLSGEEKAELEKTVSQRTAAHSDVQVAEVVSNDRTVIYETPEGCGLRQGIDAQS